jgi:hypothetical protein
MTSDDRNYFMLRAKQERQAASCCTNRIVRGRHEELAWLYEMRLQFCDRADSHEALDVAVGDSSQPIIHIGVAA